MNMPVATAATALPAHLAHLRGNAAMTSFGQDAVGGIQSGKAHPRISIRQNRFRLLNEQGQEFVVPQLHLDVIVVGVNKNVSKLYYAQAFNPGDPEPPAPTCFSDNGIAPSVRAQTPQCNTCAACPHSAWGSKVTDAGTKVKACSDSKKFAVLLADNPAGLVYELRIPAASMGNMKELVDMLNARGEPLPAMVLRITFDDKSQYPKLIFTPTSYINEAQNAAVMEVLDGEEAGECVGKDDLPIAQGAALPPPVGGQTPMAVPPVGAPVPQPPAAPVFTPAPQPLPAGPHYTPQMAPAPVVAPQPPAFNPMSTAPQGGFNPMAPAPAAPQMGQQAAEPPKARRTRKPRADAVPQGVAMNPIPQQPMVMQAPVAPQPQTYAAPQGVPAAAAPHLVNPNFTPAPVAAGSGGNLDIPQFLRRDQAGAAPAAANVPLQPQPTDQNLDALLGDALNK